MGSACPAGQAGIAAGCPNWLEGGRYWAPSAVIRVASGKLIWVFAQTKRETRMVDDTLSSFSIEREGQNALLQIETEEGAIWEMLASAKQVDKLRDELEDMLDARSP